MFRFKQRLSTILNGRQLTSAEQAGLDAYDIELEDALSATPGGTQFWAFAAVGSNPTLYNNRAVTPGITDVTISPDSPPSASVTFLYLTNNGTPGDAAVALGTYATDGTTALFADGLVTIQSVSGDVLIESLTGSVTVTPDVTGHLVLLNIPTSAPAVSGAVWRDPITNILNIVP